MYARKNSINLKKKYILLINNKSLVFFLIQKILKSKFLK